MGGNVGGLGGILKGNRQEGEKTVMLAREK